MPTDLASMEDPQGVGVGVSQDSAFPVLARALSIRGAGSAAMLALRARALSDREHIASQDYDLRAQHEELQKVNTLASIEKEKLRIADSMEMHRQVMVATKAMSELSPDDPDYQSKVLKITSENPAAAADPVIQKSIAFRDQQFIHQQETQERLQTMSMEQLNRIEIIEKEQRDRLALAAAHAAEIPEAAHMGYAKTAGDIAQFNAEIAQHTKDIAAFQATIDNPKSDPADVTTAKNALGGDPNKAGTGLNAALAQAQASLAGSQAQSAAFEQQYPGLVPKQPAPPAGASGLPAAAGVTPPPTGNPDGSQRPPLSQILGTQ